MAELQLTQLTNDDVPREFPEPLRRALLDQFYNINQLVSDLNAALEAANNAQSSSDEANSSISGITEETSSLSISSTQALETSTANRRLIAELRADVDDISGGVGDLSKYVKTDVTTHQALSGSFGVKNHLSVDDDEILYKRDLGWAPSVGTNTKGGLNADLQFTVSAVPTQPELVAIANGLVETRKVLGAIIEALTNSHKLIGPTPPTPPTP